MEKRSIHYYGFTLILIFGCSLAIEFSSDERIEYMLDKNTTSLDTTYVETERRYAIRCAKCNKLIDSNMSPKVVPRGWL